MLKTAVVGLGWWGRQIVTSLQGSEEISVTDGVDVDMESAAPFAAEKNIALGPSYDDVLDNAGIDAHEGLGVRRSDSEPGRRTQRFTDKRERFVNEQSVACVVCTVGVQNKNLHRSLTFL